MDEVNKAVKDNYGLSVLKVERIKNVYKLYADNGVYCLKPIKYVYGHFKFILAAMEHLRNKGFDSVPPIIKTLKEDKHIVLGGTQAYLTPWLSGREGSYDNPYDLEIAASALARLHKYSEGFTLERDMKPRIGWFRWIRNFQIRSEEIIDFAKRIEQKYIKSEFDNIYLKLMKKELEIAESSINHLRELDYYNAMNRYFFKRGFCHHDYAHHNLLLRGNGEVAIIDFDYCILDCHLHDLSSLLLRAMKNGKWEWERAELILKSYDKYNNLYQEDIPLMSAFMEFPQDYWQLGIQYYWEQQPWGEEFFINKLMKIKEDIEDKQDFIKEFSKYKYNGGKV